MFESKLHEYVQKNNQRYLQVPGMENQPISGRPKPYRNDDFVYGDPNFGNLRANEFIIPHGMTPSFYPNQF